MDTFDESSASDEAVYGEGDQFELDVGQAKEDRYDTGPQQCVKYRGGKIDKSAKEKTFHTTDYLDGLTTMLQGRAQKATPTKGTSGDRWLHPSLEVAPVWRKIHHINGVPVYEEDRHEDGSGECLLGHFEKQWSQLIPYSEERIVNLMLWLREVGVIDSNPVVAKRLKASIFNQMPMVPWIGSSWEYQIGGLLVAPTKKCLWRMCLLALSAMYDFAIDRNYQDGPHSWADFKVTDLLKEWPTKLSSTISKAVPGDDPGVSFQMGKEYLRTFGADYAQDRLSVEATIIELRADNEYDEPTEIHVDKKVNLYECRYVLVKNCLGNTTSAVINQEQEGSVMVNAYLWKEKIKNGTKLIPQSAFKKRMDLKTGMGDTTSLQSGGPTLFVPLEAVSMVFMFWQGVRRLVEEDGYVLDDEDEEFKDSLDLAELFIRICQCSTPSQIYDIELPACFEDSPPPKPNDDKLSKAIRQSHGDSSGTLEDRVSTSKMWLESWKTHMKTYKGDWKAHKDVVYNHFFKVAQAAHLGERAQAGGPQTGSTIALADGYIPWERPVPRTSCSIIPRHLPSIKKSARPGKHTGVAETLDELEHRIAAIILDKKCRFDAWVEKYGRYEALERQRMVLPGPEDEEIVRLWSLTKQVESGSKFCYKTCIRDHMNEAEAKADDDGIDPDIGLFFLDFIKSERNQLEKALEGPVTKSDLLPAEGDKEEVVENAPRELSALVSSLGKTICHHDEQHSAAEDASFDVPPSTVHTQLADRPLAARPSFKMWLAMACGRPSQKVPEPYHEPTDEEKMEKTDRNFWMKLEDALEVR